MNLGIGCNHTPIIITILSPVIPHAKDYGNLFSIIRTNFCVCAFFILEITKIFAIETV